MADVERLGGWDADTEAIGIGRGNAVWGIRRIHIRRMKPELLQVVLSLQIGLKSSKPKQM